MVTSVYAANERPGRDEACPVAEQDEAVRL